MKLYPPYIEGTIPAFAYSDGIGNILVPFTMNQTVSYNSIKGFAIRVKTVQSNQLVYSAQVETSSDISEIVFPIQKENFYKSYDFIIGQYYKIQIAYIEKNTNEIGYYSSIGVVKCTAKPTMYISGMSEGELHVDRGHYTGVYTNPGDLTEKLYTYYFNVYDNKGQLVTTSGEQLHNFEEDESITESKDDFNLLVELEDDKIYKIIYGGTTTNGMKVQIAAPYKIVQQSTIPPEIKADIFAEMNQDNGYVKINIIGHKNPITELEELAIGTFQIMRASEIGQYKDWQVIHRFVLYGSQPSFLDIKDFTVEQGKKYKYALQQYNNDTKLVSDKIFSNEILVNFEDCFLYDGKRQLKIKYDPKISSFKENLLETKTNTLGGQYPFIFRNGKVCYKEFPIAGTISYLMDEENLFLSDEEMGLDMSTQNLHREMTLQTGISTANTDYFEEIRKYSLLEADRLYAAYAEREMVSSNDSKIVGQKIRTNTLVDYNQAAERIFKLKVLEFLNDGKPKLFRSAAEGNYIVRLMNSSLSPKDQLGRMLHSFSTTATEVQPFNSTALESLEIITTKENTTKQMRWETILMSAIRKKADENPSEQWIKVNNYVAVSFQCLDMIPGTRIQITFEDDEDNPLEVSIGATGAYYISLDRNISKIAIHRDTFYTSEQGQITYGFYGRTFNHFDTYANFGISDIPLMQIIGDNNGNEIKESLMDIRNKNVKFNLLHFIKRAVEDVYKIIDKQGKKHYYSNVDTSVLNINEAFHNINLEDWVWYNNSKKPIAPPSYLRPISTTEDWVVNNVTYEMGYENWYDFDFDYINSKTITSLRGSVPNKPNIQSLYIYYRTNLQSEGTFKQLSPSNEFVFIFDGENEYIEELKFKIPPLYGDQKRIGYISLETYLDIEPNNLELLGIEITKFDPLKIYRIINSTIGDKEIYIDGQHPQSNKEFANYSNTIKLNGSDIDITTTLEYIVTTPEDIETIYVPTGVISDIGVQRRTVEYGIEKNSNYEQLQTTKQDWLKANLLLSYIIFGDEMDIAILKDKYPVGTGYDTNDFIQSAITADEDLSANILDAEGKYTDYFNALNHAIEIEKEKYKKYITQLTEDLKELVGEE